MNSAAVLSLVPDTPTLSVERMYRDHHAWLVGWLRSRLGCSQQAADLAHDTFLRLIRGNDVQEIREPRAWLTTVAHGLMVNQWRRKEIERAYLHTLALQDLIYASSPEQQTLVVDTLVEIDTMLASLPEKARQAFLSVHLDGMTYSQVAEKIGVSERMIKKYMAQAMLVCLRCQSG